MSEPTSERARRIRMWRVATDHPMRFVQLREGRDGKFLEVGLVSDDAGEDDFYVRLDRQSLDALRIVLYEFSLTSD